MPSLRVRRSTICLMFISPDGVSRRYSLTPAASAEDILSPVFLILKPVKRPLTSAA